MIYCANQSLTDIYLTIGYPKKLNFLEKLRWLFRRDDYFHYHVKISPGSVFTLDMNL
jgi:hypothetical protein